MTDLKGASFNNIFMYRFIFYGYQAAEGEEVPLAEVKDYKGRHQYGA